MTFLTLQKQFWRPALQWPHRYPSFVSHLKKSCDCARTVLPARRVGCHLTSNYWRFQCLQHRSFFMQVLWQDLLVWLARWLISPITTFWYTHMVTKEPPRFFSHFILIVTTSSDRSPSEVLHIAYKNTWLWGQHSSSVSVKLKQIRWTSAPLTSAESVHCSSSVSFGSSVKGNGQYSRLQAEQTCTHIPQSRV